MKKMLVIALAVMLLLGCVVTASAAGNAAERPCQQKECFVDANKDGVCDKREACIADGTCPADGQNCGRGCGSGSCQRDCFVDADKDDICDNRADCQQSRPCGRFGGGRGCGRFANR